jgi:hypothetical protein
MNQNLLKDVIKYFSVCEHDNYLPIFSFIPNCLKLLN